jgi:hypothetical protein
VTPEPVPLPTRLATSSIRARARPRAILAVWVWESMLALVATFPAAALARGTYGRNPGGDASLWDPGALPLLGLLTHEANAVRAATATAAAVLVIAAVAGLVPMAALMISISSATEDGRAIAAARSVEGALRVFRPLGVLLLLMGAGEALFVATAVLLGEGAQGWGNASFGEARAQQLAIAVGAFVLLGAVALAVVHDLARAAVVRLDLRSMAALSLGGRVFRRAPIVVTWSWAWRALASLAPIAAVGLLASRIGGRGGMALVALAMLHQAVVLSRIAFRASWLAKAMRIVDDMDASDRLARLETPHEGDAVAPSDAGDYLEASER